MRPALLLILIGAATEALVVVAANLFSPMTPPKHPIDDPLGFVLLLAIGFIALCWILSAVPRLVSFDVF